MKEKMSKKRIIIIICLILFLISISYILCFYYDKNIDKNKIQEIYNVIEKENKQDTKNTQNEKIKKVEDFKQINTDIIGWIEIPNTKINFPLLQHSDNDYYLTHDYKNEYNRYGSIFLKTECNINDNNSNLLIYGHNMKDEEMFNGLLKYENQEFYNEHKIINITTENEEREYEIIAVFKSRIFYQDEKNVFRFYYTLDLKNEEEYNDYVSNVKKIQLYDTGKTAKFGEQLLTLITCEYSQENGRMVVVAKRKLL